MKDNGSEEPAAVVFNTFLLMEREVGRLLPGMDRRKTPSSDYVFEKLREPLREYLVAEEDYADAFNRWEYLLGLVVADRKRSEWQNGWWGPVGRFVWHNGETNVSRWMPAVIKAELEAQGNEWPLLKFGLFGGAKEAATTAVDRFNQHVGAVAGQMMFG